MKKITINEYRQREFAEGSAPTERTVRNWCQDQEIPAKKLGGKWYILVEEKKVNPLVAKVLA